jgi:hypothetical protein
MTRHFIFSVFFFLTATVAKGQNFGDYYVSISIIEGLQGGRLKFLSDTTVELSAVSRHMTHHLSPSFKSVFKYNTTDTTIQIFPENVISKDTQSSDLYVLHIDLKAKTILTKIDGGFIDYGKSLIYVRQEDFGDSPGIAYIIDNRTFIHDVGVRYGTGLSRKKPTTNEALLKKLKGLDKSNCTIEIVKGLDVYKRFGITEVYGAVVITTNK